MKIGEGAYVGSGSVITRDVEAGALAIARGSQEDREGWATRYNKVQSARKHKSAVDKKKD